MSKAALTLTRPRVSRIWLKTLTFGTCLLLEGTARAHEDYARVRDPRYVTALGAHCCSEQHCQPAAAGELTPIPGGWRHVPTQTEILADKPGIYQTEDKAGRLFRCVMGGKLVCVMEGLGS